MSKTYTLSTKAQVTEVESKSIWVRSQRYSLLNNETKDVIVDGSKTLLETLLMFLKLLVRDDHPARVFNIYQLNKVNLVDSLLTSCKVSIFKIERTSYWFYDFHPCVVSGTVPQF